MINIIQLVTLLVSVVCIGQAIKTGATKFDKIAFSVFCLLFILFTVGLQVVK